MSDPAVLYEVQDHVAIITLNRPDNRNSLTTDLLDAYSETMKKVRAQGDVRAVVITGKGRSFCAGADFKAQPQGAAGDRNLQPHERLLAIYGPFLETAKIEVPVIGALNGHAVGGGLALALLCDIRIVNRQARYGANFARLGLHSGLGISYMLPRVVGAPRAAELLFTGRLFDGEEAETIGFALEAVEPDQVMSRAMDLAAQIAGNAPIVVRMMKRSLYKGLAWNVEDGARFEAFAQAATINTKDCMEGVRALLEKRDPVFRDE